MAVRGIDRQRGGWSLEKLGLAIGAGLASGGVVSLAAFVLARYGPAGDSWSFRGNGALAAYSLIPALLAGGWTAVVMDHRGRPWAGMAAAAAGVGLALAVVDAALLPVFGPGTDQTVGPIVLLALAAWTVVSPVAAMLGTRARRLSPAGAGPSIAAAIAWAAGVAAGVVSMGVAFPAGS